MKITYFLSLTVLIGLYCFPARTQIIVDFETDTTGTEYQGETWESKGFVTVSWTQGAQRTAVVETLAHSGEKSLQVYYPQGKYGPQETGHQAPCGLTPMKEYYISYWLRFSNDFSWGTANEGGKLPGLSGGKKCSGGETCDGTNGFTARFMWRKDGIAVLYLYHMDKPDTYGEDFPLINARNDTMYFTKGQWINIVEWMKVNSGTNKDGEVQVWFNGTGVLNLDSLQFVTNGDMVDAFYFSTFHGGNDTSWSPQNDCYIWFDDIVVTTDRIAEFTSIGFE